MEERRKRDWQMVAIFAGDKLGAAVGVYQDVASRRPIFSVKSGRKVEGSDDILPFIPVFMDRDGAVEVPPSAAVTPLLVKAEEFVVEQGRKILADIAREEAARAEEWFAKQKRQERPRAKPVMRGGKTARDRENKRRRAAGQ